MNLNEFITHDWSTVGTSYNKTKIRQNELNAAVAHHLPNHTFDFEVSCPDAYDGTFNVDMIDHDSNIFFLIKAPKITINKNKFNMANTTTGEINRLMLSPHFNITKDSIFFINILPTKTFTISSSNSIRGIEDVKNTKPNMSRVLNFYNQNRTVVKEINLWYDLPDILINQHIQINIIREYFIHNSLYISNLDELTYE